MRQKQDLFLAASVHPLHTRCNSRPVEITPSAPCFPWFKSHCSAFVPFLEKTLILCTLTHAYIYTNTLIYTHMHTHTHMYEHTHNYANTHTLNSQPIQQMCNMYTDLTCVLYMFTSSHTLNCRYTNIKGTSIILSPAPPTPPQHTHIHTLLRLLQPK